MNLSFSNLRFRVDKWKEISVTDLLGDLTGTVKSLALKLNPKLII
jgi:hypothetical protein